MLTLTIVKGPGTGQLFPLDKPEVVVGREPGEGLTLEDLSVSRRHFRLILGKSTPEIEDLGSRNGTLLNGKPVTRHALNDGDSIEIGQTTLRFDLIKTREEDLIFDENFNATATIPMQVLRTQVLGIRDGQSRDVAALNKARNALAAANRAGQIISAILSTDELYRKVPLLVLEEIPHVDRCAVLLKTSLSTALKPESFAVRDAEGAKDMFPFSRLLAKYTCDEQMAVLIQDMLKDERFQIEDSVQTQKIHSAICVPLISKSVLLGVLYADTLNPSAQFSQDDLKLLAMISLQVCTTLETARLYENLLEQKAASEAAHRDLKEAQEKMLQHEKMAAIGEFSAGLVHDLKNPLAVILGHTQFCQIQINRQENVPQEFREKLFKSLGEVEKGVAHTNHIVEQLLEFARKSTPYKTDSDINALIEEILGFVQPEAEKASVIIARKLQADLPVIQFDYAQIKRAFINIVMNAIQAMPQGGKLTVETSLQRKKPGTEILIRFTDTGVGMTPEETRKVFQPFFTTKTKTGNGYTGTGLGMSVTYGIISNHDGCITLTSKKGEGTTFFVTLPVQLPAAVTQRIVL
ncbi:MAG: ATP-binding protein [Kiritimatiellia bacterium]